MFNRAPWLRVIKTTLSLIDKCKSPLIFHKRLSANFMLSIKKMKHENALTWMALKASNPTKTKKPRLTPRFFFST